MGLNKNAPQELIYLNTSSAERGTVWKIGRYNLIGGSVSLYMGCEVSNAQQVQALSAYKSLPIALNCFPSDIPIVMLPTMMKP